MKRLIFILLPFTFFAQSQQIDSLKNTLREMPDDTNKVNTLNKINKLLWQNGRYEEALQQSEMTLERGRKLNFKRGMASSYNSIGVVWRNKGNYAKSLENYLQALRLCEEIQDLNGISKCYNNIGLLYNTIGENDKALPYYTRALAIDEKMGNKAGVAIRLGNIGSVYMDLMNYPMALQYYTKALKIDSSLGNIKEVAKGYGNIGNIYAEIGDSLREAGNMPLAIQRGYSKAEIYYKRSIATYMNGGYEDLIATSQGNLGQLYSLLGKYPEAEVNIKKALASSRAMGDLYQVKDHEEFLTNLYQKMGRYEDALEHYKKFISARDSVFNEENTKKIVRSEMNYAFEKKTEAARLQQERKDAIAEAEKKRQNIILLSVCGFGVLVLGFAVFAWRSFLQKKKTNEEISLQKRIIEEKQKEVLDSIYYARRIQRTLMPNEKYMDKALEKLKGAQANLPS